MENGSQFKPGTFTLVPNKHKLNTLSSRAILAWFCLCSFANSDGECFPSMNTMAEMLSVDNKTISRGIDELLDKKWIKKQTRKKEDGSYSSNFYTLYIF
jgi:DNA-binding MarR family transcriptional regulator